MTVLIVDDEEDLRDLISNVVENKLKMNCICAGSVAEAKEIIQKSPKIDAIICDYHMKMGSGGDLYHYLKSENLNIPFILCSGDGLENHAEFSSADLAGFLQKPFLAKDVVNQLQKVFGSLN